MDKFIDPESKITIEEDRDLPVWGRSFQWHPPTGIQIHLDLRGSEIRIKRLKEYDEYEILAGEFWSIRISKELAQKIERIVTLGADADVLKDMPPTDKIYKEEVDSFSNKEPSDMTLVLGAVEAKWRGKIRITHAETLRLLNGGIKQQDVDFWMHVIQSMPEYDKLEVKNAHIIKRYGEKLWPQYKKDHKIIIQWDK